MREQAKALSDEIIRIQMSLSTLITYESKATLQNILVTIETKQAELAVLIDQI